jgi:hypothetical protein
MGDANGTSEAGYYFLNSELGKPLAALGTFVGGGAGWAGSATHYTLAIVTGASAAVIFALAFCAEAKVSAQLKHYALGLTVCGILAGSCAAAHYSNELIERNQRAAQPALVAAPSKSAKTDGDQAPAVVDSPGTVVTYNIGGAVPSATKHSK